MDRSLIQYHIRQFVVRYDLECILMGLKEGICTYVDLNCAIHVTKFSPTTILFRATVFRRHSYPRELIFEPYELGIRVGIRNVSTQTE